jgi:acetyltransferase-like isoleucine patch superfamily enzyme
LISRIARLLLVLIRRAGSAWRLLVIRIAYPQIRLGRGLYVGRGAIVKATDGGSMDIGDRTAIAPGAVLNVRGGRLTIGPDGFVGEGAMIVCRQAITIGADALIAEHVTIRDQDHAFTDLKTAIHRQGFVTKPVTLGRDVWLGAKAVVLKGVTIGDGSVIGAASVVNRDIPAMTIAAGAPAKPLRSRS